MTPGWAASDGVGCRRFLSDAYSSDCASSSSPAITPAFLNPSSTDTVTPASRLGASWNTRPADPLKESTEWWLMVST